MSDVGLVRDQRVRRLCQRSSQGLLTLLVIFHKMHAWRNETGTAKHNGVLEK